MVFTGGRIVGWRRGRYLCCCSLHQLPSPLPARRCLPCKAMICCALGQDGTQIEYIMPDALQLTSSASSQYLDTFLPVIAAFPAVPLLLDAQKSGYSRFCLLRAGRAPWLCGQLLAGWFCWRLQRWHWAIWPWPCPTLMLLPWQDITPAQLLVSSPLCRPGAVFGRRGGCVGPHG